MSTGVAIVGAAEADEIGVVPHKSSVQLHAEAATNALATRTSPWATSTRCTPVAWTSCRHCSSASTSDCVRRYSSSNSIGGSSFVAHVHEAVQAIRAGRCEVALITHGETRRSNRRRGVQTRPAHFDPWLPDWQWERPYGVDAPPPAYALAATRHMHEYGTTTGTSPSSRSPRAPGPS